VGGRAGAGQPSGGPQGRRGGALGKAWANAPKAFANIPVAAPPFRICAGDKQHLHKPFTGSSGKISGRCRGVCRWRWGPAPRAGHLTRKACCPGVLWQWRHPAAPVAAKAPAARGSRLAPQSLAVIFWASPGYATRPPPLMFAPLQPTPVPPRSAYIPPRPWSHPAVAKAAPAPPFFPPAPKPAAPAAPGPGLLPAADSRRPRPGSPTRLV
jgi:hypothetical protein